MARVLVVVEQNSEEDEKVWKRKNKSKKREKESTNEKENGAIDSCHGDDHTLC